MAWPVNHFDPYCAWRVRLPGNKAGLDFEVDAAGELVLVSSEEDAWREWQAEHVADGIHRITGIEDMARARAGG